MPAAPKQPMTKTMKAQKEEKLATFAKTNPTQAVASGALDDVAQQGTHALVSGHDSPTVDAANVHYYALHKGTTIPAAHPQEDLPQTTLLSAGHTQYNGFYYRPLTYGHGQELQVYQVDEAQAYEGNATGPYIPFNLPLPSTLELDPSAQQEYRFQQALKDLFENGGACSGHCEAFHAQTPLSCNAQAQTQHHLDEIPAGPFKVQMGEMCSFNIDDLNGSQWGNPDLGQWAVGGDLIQRTSDSTDRILAAPASTSSADILASQPVLGAVTYDDDTFGFGSPEDCDAPFDQISNL